MTHPVDIYVGNQIRKLRLARGMTQMELARKIGVKFQQLQKYETAVNRVSASRLYDTARALGVSVFSLFPEYDSACEATVD